MFWGPDVYTKQNLMPLAQQSELSTAAIHHGLCPAALAYQHWSSLNVIILRTFLNFFWWLKVKLKAAKKAKRLFGFLGNLRPGMI